MATVTSSVNLDTITRGAIEDITVSNGAVLTINTDVRYSAGAPSAGASSIGEVTCNASTPGTVFIDGRDVWWLGYTSGASTVVGYNAVISGVTSGATGVFMNVTSGLAYAPVASGASMPSTGFIKFKSKNGTFATGEALQYAGTTLGTTSSAGQTGWIEVPVRETDGFTLAGNGTLSVSGEWFYLDDTTGVAGQIIQGPNQGGTGTRYAGLWIETASGVGTYECYPAITAGAGSPWKLAVNSGIATDVRGKFVEMLDSGRLRIGSDGTNNVGYVPPAGCRTRIGNVLLSASAVGTPALNALPNTSNLASRPDFATAQPGEVLVDKAMTGWYFYLNRFRNARMSHVALHDLFYFFTLGSRFYLEDVNVGCYNIAGDHYPFRASQCSQGGDLINCKLGRIGTAGSGDYGAYFDYCADITSSGNSYYILNVRSATSAYASRASACTNFISTNDAFYGSALGMGSTGATITNSKYCDNMFGNTITTFPPNGSIQLLNSTDVVIDGFALVSGLTEVHNYGAIVAFDGAIGVQVKNIGTKSVPFNHGTVNPTTYSFYMIASTSSSDIRLKRCYTTGATTAFFLGTSTGDDVVIQDCSGGYGLAMTTDTLVCTNQQVKNLACASWGTANTVAVGSHFHNIFVNTVSGRLGVAMNEPSDDSTEYCVLTPLTGTAYTGWSRTGTLNLREAGDRIEWTWPYKVLGVNGFQNSDGVLSGTNTSNHTFYYAIKHYGDTSYSAWKLASAANLSAETPSADHGFDLKFLISGNTSNISNALTGAYLLTYASGTAQDVQYPLTENFVTVSTNGLLANSRIQLYNVTTSGEMANEVIASGEYSLVFDSDWPDTEASVGDTLRLRAAKLGYLPYEVLGSLSSAGLEFIVDQEVDSVYTTNAIDGSTVTEFALDIPFVDVDISDLDGTTTVQRMYNWFSHAITTESGIRSAFGGLTALDEVNYRFNSDIVSFEIDNTGVDPLHVMGGYLFRSDGAQIIASGSGPMYVNAGKAYLATGEGVSASGVWSHVLEGTLTAKEIQRVLLAVAAGITNITDLGGGNATVKFYSQDGLTTRVEADMTGSERTDTTVNGA